MAIPAETQPAPMSVKLFAVRLGVDREAVRKAIANGRLTKSIGHNSRGWPEILDVALAEREWTENQDIAKVRGPAMVGIGDHRKRLIKAQTRKLNQAYRERAGKLVSAQEVEMRWSTLIVTARNKLLGIPSRARQRSPELTAAQMAVIDELIREALEELAGGPSPA